MNDCRLKSLSEVALNIAVGFWINFVLNSIIFPVFGIPFDFIIYMQIGGLYTIASLFQTYPIRRAFNRIWKNQPKSGSFAETILNFIIGWIVGYAFGLVVLPYFGMNSTLDITAVNTIGAICSAIRRYLFRRLFNMVGKDENLYTLSLRVYVYAKQNIYLSHM